jgi:Na+/H+ antiporter NhaD/arsenite permease-like protein
VSKTSLRLRLFSLWALSLVACLAVGLLLAQLYRQSTAAQVGRAEADIAKACGLIQDGYGAYAGKWSEAAPALSDQKLRLDLATVVRLALAGRNGVEGGVWQKEAGSLAYAFPTYEGTGPKNDLPAAERDSIQAVSDEAARDGRAVDRQSAAGKQTLLLHACPLSGPIPRLTAWAMTRVEAVPYFDQLRFGLSALLGFMLLMSAWLGRVLIVWARYMSGVEAAPADAGVDVGAPPAPAEEREADRAALAHSEAGQRPVKAHQEFAVPAAQVSHVERLAIGLVGGIVALALLAALATFVSPGSVLGSDTVKLAAGAIFVGSYLALAIGRIPGLSIDRAGIALVGAGLMVASGTPPLEGAYEAVDGNTIALLLGMMIVVASLRLSGFFAVANAWAIAHARRPLILLGAVVATSGVFSAFLVNDAICLVLTPLVLELTVALGRRPAPYLLAVAMASNVGSTATITGNPQNMMIGSYSHIPYTQFALALTPVALVGLIVTVALIALFYREEFFGDARLQATLPKMTANRALMVRSLLATLVLIASFFAGVVPAKAALIVGGLLLLTRRIKSRRVYQEIDWSLLLMFAGLFVIVAGAQRALLSPEIIADVGRLHLDQVPALSAITAVLSNLVSNVPAVLMLKPFVEGLKDHDRAWLIIAMASTLAGNFTVLGSVANLIVVQTAAASGVTISFWDYFRVGAPLTLVTLAIGTLWLWLWL